MILFFQKWWDDLWLNEGFATYMSFLGTDYISDNKFKMVSVFRLKKEDVTVWIYKIIYLRMTTLLCIHWKVLFVVISALHLIRFTFRSKRPKMSTKYLTQYPTRRFVFIIIITDSFVVILGRIGASYDRTFDGQRTVQKRP